MACVARLHDRDRAALLEAVETVAATTTVEALSRAAILAIRQLIPTTLAAWNEVASDGTIDTVMAPEPPAIWPEAPDAFARNVSDHPVIEFYQRTGDGRPYAISDFLSPAEFHQTGLYREFYVRLNAEDQLSFIVPDPDRIIGIALNRDRPGFSERDRTVANLIRPHLTYAYRNARAHERVRYLSATLEELAEDRDEGVILLDHRGRAGHVSPSGARMLRQWFPDDPGAALPAQVLDWLDAQPALVNGQFVIERAGRMLSIRHLGGGGRRDSTLLISEQQDPDPQRRAPAARADPPPGRGGRLGHAGPYQRGHRRHAGPEHPHRRRPYQRRSSPPWSGKSQCRHPSDPPGRAGEKRTAPPPAVTMTPSVGALRCGQKGGPDGGH